MSLQLQLKLIIFGPERNGKKKQTIKHIKYLADLLKKQSKELSNVLRSYSLILLQEQSKPISSCLF